MNSLCGAKTKKGNTCRAFSGQGTDHPGFGRCKYHGGSTPNGKLNAVKLEAQAALATKMGQPIKVHPLEALLQLLYISYGHVAWFAEEIAKVDDLQSQRTLMLLNLYGGERDRATRTAKAAIDAGVAERQVRLAEEYGSMLANLLGAIFEGPELGLTAKQRAALPTVLPRHLRVVDGGAGCVPRAALPSPRRNE